MSEQEPDFEQESEQETLKSVERFLEGQDPISVWDRERKTSEHQEIYNTAEKLSELLRTRRRQVAQKEGVKSADELEISDRYNFYTTAEHLKSALMQVLEDPFAVAGRTLSVVERPEFYIDEEPLEPLDPNDKVGQQIDQMRQRIREENCRNVKRIDEGEIPNAAQSYLAHSVVNAFNRLGWPGDEVAEVLKKHGLYTE